MESTTQDGKNHPLYNAFSPEWKEQDLAYTGGRVWRSWCIQRHPLECKEKTTSTEATTRFYSRLFYSTNPVSVFPPIQNVQNSAQKSSSDAELNAGNEYLNTILNFNANGEGLNWYTWIAGEPLASLARNKWVYLGVELPPSDKEGGYNLRDYEEGTVPPPKMIFLSAAQVVNWRETEGDIKNGQFSALRYKSSIVELDPKTNFDKVTAVEIVITADELRYYDGKTGSEIESKREVNTLGFVPFVRAEISSSLIGDAVQYSKQAVELDSLATSNMRDGYFNIIQALGFKMSATSADGEPMTLSADRLVETPAPDQKIEFASPNTAPEAETREKIKALQEHSDISVQQAHSNFAKQGASIGSGVAYKELSNDQASSVKYMMDNLLDKFAICVFYAQKMTGLGGDIELSKPSDYTFTSESDSIDNAMNYQDLTTGAISKESKKAYNRKANAQVFEGEELKKVNEADDQAIDATPAPVPTDF